MAKLRKAKCYVRGVAKRRSQVKSHIIPRSFFMIPEGGKPLKQISNIPKLFPRKVPIGVYDNQILCGDCELVFKDYDQYGHNTLIENEEALEELEISGSRVGFILRDIDYSMLKLFFISVLWRASISNQQFYSNVNLGYLENFAKELVWGRRPGNKHNFSFVLAKFETNWPSATMLNPHIIEWFGVKYFQIYMGRYVLSIKGSIKRTPVAFERFITSNNELLMINRGDFENSNEYSVVLDVFANQKN